LTTSVTGTVVEEMQMRKPRMALLAFFCLVFLAHAAIAAATRDTCSLPLDLKSRISTKYPDARLVHLSDLSGDHRGFFQKDHGNACPGMVKVDFYGDHKPTLALVLLTKKDAKRASALLLARQIGGTWQLKVLDTADAVPVPVVSSQPPGKYQDVGGEKELTAKRPVIVWSGYESWEILYAWTGKSVAKIWTRD
jgi:hypothetical protein